jgi:hypothetical protein
MKVYLHFVSVHKVQKDQTTQQDVMKYIFMSCKICLLKIKCFLYLKKSTSRVNKTESKQRKRQINDGKPEGLVVLGMPVTAYSLFCYLVYCSCVWLKINIFYPCYHN